jgi:two-component system OmpR family sensor kinase
MPPPVPLGTVSPAPASRSADVRTIPLRVAVVDLAALTSSTLEPLQKEARALDVTLTVDAPADVGLVSVDPEKVAWAIATLAGNALRYVRRGSRRRPGGDIAVRIRRDAGARTMTISVEDDGPGIPADKVSHLFERQAGSQHAIGLGLTLVNDIVVAHGGTVRVDSSTDHQTCGTRVCMRLPTA